MHVGVAECGQEKGKKASCQRILKECKGSHFFKSLSPKMYQHKVMCGSYRAEKQDNSSHTSRLSKYARKGLKEVAFSFPLNDMNTGEIDDEAKREKSGETCKWLNSLV